MAHHFYGCLYFFILVFLTLNVYNFKTIDPIIKTQTQTFLKKVLSFWILCTKKVKIDKKNKWRKIKNMYTYIFRVFV